MPKPKPQYRARVGISYPDPDKPKAEKRAEPGETVSDLPAHAIPGLIAEGAIEPIENQED